MSSLLLPMSGTAAGPWTVEGRVVGVHDGDTITLLDRSNAQHRIRLAGCDAPEKGQPFGQVSKDHLSRLVFDRTVRAACAKRDRYGREVCRLRVGPRDACLEQVRDGLAWHYVRFQNEQTAEERQAFSEAEQRARAAGRGLWSEPAPVAPWDWRNPH